MAKIYEGATVRVLNWKKYTTRKDIKASAWWRCSNTFLEDPDFYGFTDGEMLFVVYLFSQCSKRITDSVKLIYEHAERIGRRTEADVNGAVKKLVERQIVAVDVTCASRERHATDRQTDKEIHAHPSDAQPSSEQNQNQEEPPPREEKPKFDADAVYSKYPRKIGKKRGVKIFQREITSQEKFEKITQAVENYARRCKDEKTPKRFIMHFSTFMGEWEDWIVPEEVSAAAAAPPTDPKLEAEIAAMNQRAKAHQPNLFARLGGAS